jgi:hypothetical protein
MSAWDAPGRKALSGPGHLGLRIWLALGTAVLAIASLAFPGLHQRIDSTVLLLLVSVPLILLVPWDKMSSLKAVGVEITLNLPQVREAVKSSTRSQARRAATRSTTGGSLGPSRGWAPTFSWPKEHAFSGSTTTLPRSSGYDASFARWVSAP